MLATWKGGLSGRRFKGAEACQLAGVLASGSGGSQLAGEFEAGAFGRGGIRRDGMLATWKGRLSGRRFGGGGRGASWLAFGRGGASAPSTGEQIWGLSVPASWLVTLTVGRPGGWERGPLDKGSQAIVNCGPGWHSRGGAFEGGASGRATPAWVVRSRALAGGRGRQGGGRRTSTTRQLAGV